MSDWTCSACDEASPPQFDLCWNCGTHADGSMPDAAFVREDAPAVAPPDPVARRLACLRCGEPMRHRGTRAFHEGSRAQEVLLGEFFVGRERFDLYACNACGRAEFFMADAME
jgi:predicted amidophosphoribosyltransferase